jgi:CheY-like chemotaxis protein
VLVKKVLVIEDNLAIVELYRTTLAIELDVSIATNQRQSIIFLESGVLYDYIILDGYVPIFPDESRAMLTTDLIFRIHMIHPGAVIYATSSDPEVVEACMGYGCIASSKFEVINVLLDAVKRQH